MVSVEFASQVAAKHGSKQGCPKWLESRGQKTDACKRCAPKHTQGRRSLKAEEDHAWPILAVDTNALGLQLGFGRHAARVVQELVFALRGAFLSGGLRHFIYERVMRKAELPAKRFGATVGGVWCLYSTKPS